MRTIEGWTDEEIKALKRLKDVYNKIVRYMHGSSDVTNLSGATN